MEFTDVQVKLISDGDDRLKASCTLVIDGEFVVRDVKVIDGNNGLFVAMPTRKLADHCPQCHHKNHLRAKFCNECGASLPGSHRGDGNSQQYHTEIAHPINSACRSKMHGAVIAAYEQARGKAIEQVSSDDPGEQVHRAAEMTAGEFTAGESTFPYAETANPPGRDEGFGAGL